MRFEVPLAPLKWHPQKLTFYRQALCFRHICLTKNLKTQCLSTKAGFAACFSRVLKNAKRSPQPMKMTCFRYGFERYPLSLPKFNLDDRRGVFAIIYPHKFPQSVYFCRQAQHLRSIRSQRVSFETVLKTRNFHRQVRCFRVFLDPQKSTPRNLLLSTGTVFFKF